jgi:hypothetical protein
MRTNGLVGALVIALIAASHSRATAQLASSSSAEIREVMVDLSTGAEQSAIRCQDSDSWFWPDDWHDFLIGSTDTYHVYAGTEFTALHVASQTGGRITLSFSDTTAPGVATSAFNDESGLDDWAYAPRVWLGMQITDKWGFRGRYWRLSGSDAHSPDPNPAIPTVGTNFSTIFTTDHAEAWTTDFEATRSGQLGQWKFDGFLGGRHASFSTDSDLLAFGVFTTGNFVNMTLQNSCDFDGTGVTYGGTLRRRIGDSHLYAFVGARGSKLDGHTNSLGRADGTVASSPSAPLVGAATVTRNHADAEMSIYELQAGLEFEWALREIPANFFFRTAYEYQKWDIDGLPTGGAGFGGTIGELTTNSFASAGLGGMVLEGITIGTGLTW